MARKSSTTTARATDSVTATVTIETTLTTAQRSAIRRVIDRRNERSDGQPVIRQRGGFFVTILPSEVDGVDERGGPAFPTAEDVRDAAVRAAHAEAHRVALAIGSTFRYSVSVN